MISVVNHLSVVLVGPDEDDLLGFAEWCSEHVDNESTQYFGDMLVVEPRYVAALLEGLQADGFDVEGWS